MSAVSTANHPTAAVCPDRPARNLGDALAVGMLVMLVMTVAGRGIGFVRNMIFCRMMTDADVGRWSMAYGFITLITPVMLLGIPGLLPRFTEVYRLRGELLRFVTRNASGTFACAAIFLIAMLMFPDWFGWIVFSQPEAALLMRSVAFAVLGMIVYNFVSDLCGSLRLVRVVSLMQFSQGVSFTVLSCIWLQSGGSLTGVIGMFAIASLLVAIGGGLVLWRRWTTVSEADEFVTQETSSWWAMICRMAPYAGSIWLMNLIGNLFELSDRTMILHYLGQDSTGGAESSMLAGQAAVGQYHAGRMIPMLLLSLATMISGVLLPYLAADFEAERLSQVHRRVRNALLLVSIVFTLGSATVLAFGPWLFDTLLQGRYSEGLAILPMALCFSTWAALVTVGQNYLWTIEKGKWIAVAMTLGLACNVGLNAMLLPIMGLNGAVVATLISHAVVLIALWVAMICNGFRADASLVILSMLPLSLLISPVIAFVASISVTVLTIRQWLPPAWLPQTLFGRT